MERLRSRVMEVSCPSEGGIEPVKLFVSSWRRANWVRFPSSEGIFPEKPLLSSHKFCMFFRLPISLGRGPVNELIDRARVVNLVQLVRIGMGKLPWS